MKVRNFTGALIVAVVLALPLAIPTIHRIDTWKIVVGIAGLMIFVGAGMSSRS